MFRAVLLSIVLTVAAAPNAALLCATWCHSGARMVAGACEHQRQSATPGIGANEDCAVNGNPFVFVREDGRRSAAAPNVVGAAAVAPFAFTSPASGTLPTFEPNSQPPLERRPLILALRI